MKKIMILIALSHQLIQTMEHSAYSIDRSTETPDIDLGYLSDSLQDFQASTTVTTTNMLFNPFDFDSNPTDDYSINDDMLPVMHTNHNPSDQIMFTTEYFKVDGWEFGTRLSHEENLKNLERLVNDRKEQCPIMCCHKNFFWKTFIDHYARVHKTDSPTCPNPACQHRFANATNACMHYLSCIKHDMFKCPSCQQTYSSKDSLQTHFLKCISNSPHLLRKKRVVRKRTDQEEIAQLEKRNHRLNTYLNNKTMVLSGCCNKQFATWAALKNHLLGHHSEKKFVSCPWPDCTTKNLNKYVADVASCYVLHFDPNFFSCSNCKKSCTTFLKLKEHYINCKKTYKPDPQLLELVQSSDYQTGLKILLEQRQSKIISRSAQQPNPFVQRVYDLILKQLHDKFEKNSIACCNTVFSSMDLLSDHIKTKHAANKKGFACPECGKISNSSSRTLSCFLNARDTRFYECIFCKHVLNAQESLVSHITTSCMNLTHYIAKQSPITPSVDNNTQPKSHAEATAPEDNNQLRPHQPSFEKSTNSAWTTNNEKKIPRIILKVSIPQKETVRPSMPNNIQLDANSSLSLTNNNNTNYSYGDTYINEC